MKQTKHKRVKVLRSFESPKSRQYIVARGILCKFNNQWDEFVWVAICTKEGWLVLNTDCGLSVGSTHPTMEEAIQEARDKLSTHTPQEVTNIIKEHPIPRYKYWKSLKVRESITENDIKEWENSG